MGEMAKIFWTGRSQAVRLPKDYRFDSTEVRIRREGRQVILEPLLDNWDWLNSLEPLDTDAAIAALERPGPESYERPEISFD